MPKLAISSSPEEWAAKGKELFERKCYLQAKHCYERALMPREMMISDAYLLREQARKLTSGNSRRLKDECHAAFLIAAHKFLSCAAEAGRSRIIYFRRASECFQAAQDDEQAAEAYLKAGDYDIAAKLFRKLGQFDAAIDVIDVNGEQMSKDVVETIKDVARLHYFRGKELTCALSFLEVGSSNLTGLTAKRVGSSRQMRMNSNIWRHLIWMLHVRRSLYPSEGLLKLQSSTFRKVGPWLLFRCFWKKRKVNIRCVKPVVLFCKNYGVTCHSEMSLICNECHHFLSGRHVLNRKC